jgi:cytochrome c
MAGKDTLLMLRRRYLVGLSAALLVAARQRATAGAHGTPEEAKAMVDKAVALIQSDGADKAFTVIDDSSGPFVTNDLYVFVSGFDGVTKAHGVTKAMIGKNLLNVKDADGNYFVQEMIDLAKTKGEGWVDYKWVNPTTHRIEAKTTFVRRVGDLIVGCGVYKD